ncbi:7083_t:CDS:2 [Ambispora leptoticha]|uniref:7083_t:CDS:1 n=1 Tax=Ambispora leptoticha TaxID=144679 RepID=A0A9N9H9H1_9GLOM|nr:7083_t:CDS:2 [Ambispora leptoticha]
MSPSDSIWTYYNKLGYVSVDILESIACAEEKSINEILQLDDIEMWDPVGEEKVLSEKTDMEDSERNSVKNSKESEEEDISESESESEELESEEE